MAPFPPCSGSSVGPAGPAMTVDEAVSILERRMKQVWCRSWGTDSLVGGRCHTVFRAWETGSPLDVLDVPTGMLAMLAWPDTARLHANLWPTCITHISFQCKLLPIYLFFPPAACRWTATSNACPSCWRPPWRSSWGSCAPSWRSS